MNAWTILGIEKTNDLRKVKEAYAEKTKLYHPETHPEEFQKLHNAYKRIITEIRGSTDYLQQIQVQKSLEMNFRKEIHNSVRDIKQDEDFLKLVEEAAKNFEARHTDKRDPAQVAKVEYILQHDNRNSKLLGKFQWMLHNEFFAEGWREFFINEEFLERQYEPEFINGMTEILKSRLLERQRITKTKKCSLGLGVMVYFIIVYGAIFEGIEHLQLDKKVYRKDLLQDMTDMFRVYVDKRDAYLLIEQREGLLGEQYAFFLYRRILEELDADRPAKEKILETIREGFQREGISKVFFDLLLYLITSNRKNISIFRMALAQACEIEWNNSIQDEIEILKLELGEFQEENIEQEMHRTETQQAKVQNVETRTKEIQTKEQILVQRKGEEEKINRKISKWLFLIAGIILCINVYCRMVDAQKSTEYVRTTGIVTSVSERSEWHAGKRSYSYRVYVDYETRGWWGTLSTSESSSFNKFSKGDTMPVLYRKDNVFEVYIAKKDWMTGAYLPVNKWYNVPLVISVVLFIVGFLLYTNSPILELLERVYENRIGKNRG